MKRYAIEYDDHHDCDGDMVEHKDGEWVHYEDVAALIAVVRDVEQEVRGRASLMSFRSQSEALVSWADRLRAALPKEGQP